MGAIDVSGSAMANQTSEKPKGEPDDNPWYLLATLYGRPRIGVDFDLKAKNRVAWNRYMARSIPEEVREQLIKEGRYSIEELTPFLPEELRAVEKFFAERSRSAAGAGITNLNRDQIDFSGLAFDSLFLQGFIFPSPCLFSNATFSSVAHFAHTIFSDQANFEDVTFSQRTSFHGATFSERTSFHGATFSRLAEFTGTTFSLFARFGRATFSDGANFEGATFSSGVDFAPTTFSGWALFTGATFSGNVSFEDVTFSGNASFARATFQSRASFVNAEMKSQTWFEAATFSSEPPLFFGAKLHEGTVWRDVDWPDPPSDAVKASEFVDAYERLKLEMDRLKKHEDELDFFACELRSRRVQCGDWKPIRELRFFGRTIPIPTLEIPRTTIKPRCHKLFGRSFTLPSLTIRALTIELRRPASGLAIALYGFLCDFGRSYVRPLAILIATIVLGIFPFWAHFGLSKLGQASGLSLANTFGVLGIRKDFIEPNVIAGLPGVLKLVGGLQTIAGIVLIFFFSLALRNRFRMK
jgi:hypothetical protein